MYKTIVNRQFVQQLIDANNISNTETLLALLTFCEKNPLVAGGFPSRRANNAATLQWRHNERNGVENHQPHHCLLNGLFRRRSKKTPKLGVTGLCEGNSPVTDEFPTQRASNAENVSIRWRHHEAFPCHGPLARYAKSRVRMRRECRERFPRHRR